MATRFKTSSSRYQGQPPLPSGYENIVGTPDLSIPPCGIEDVDVALFNLFDKEIVAEYGGTNSTSVTKVPVVFAAGEKWAMLKNGRPLRDRNNTLILPLITVMRTELNQTAADDVVGRGVNQQIGEIVVKRRLDKTDRDYQALINRILLPNQQNLAVKPDDPQVPGQVSTDRKLGQLAQTGPVEDGAYLVPNRKNNVWETIVVPTPQFFTAKYQVTIWTQYTQHSNQIIEKIFSSMLPQGQSWKLTTPKGYWFVAKMEDGSLAAETSFEDMSTTERFIKHNFSVAVPAYFFVNSSPGMPVPIKRYVSSPSISFEALTYDPVELGSSEPSSEYVVGSDDPTLPLDLQRNNRKDQRSIGWRQQKIYPVQSDPLTDSRGRPRFDPSATVNSEDPAFTGNIGVPGAASGNASNAFPRGYAIKVISKTPKGETVFSGASLGGLEIILVDGDPKI